MKPAIRIALLYAALSGLYILSSDWAAYQFFQNDPKILTEWQTFKGVMFVAISSLIIFFLVLHFEKGRETARKQTNIALDSFQQLFERNPLPVWVYDTTSLRCLAANAAVSAEYGYTQEEFLRLKITALHPPEDLEKILAFISRVKAQPRASHWRHVRKDGSVVDVEVTSHPISFAGHEARLIVAQNVTARKIAERALAEALAAKSEAQLAKTRFLSSISHEMRTPLHTMTGYLDLLVNEQDPKMRAEYGEVVQRSGGELLDLIDRMVQAADLQAPMASPKIHEVETSAFFQKLVDEFLPTALRGGIRVELDVVGRLPAISILDVDRVQEVLHILLENAVKFSPAGTVTVQVKVLYADPARSQLVVAVHDEGIGIPVEKQGEIFELFTQADARLSRKYGGAGLGLFVARQLSELMGAALSVTSTPGEGSCFTLSVRGRMENAERFVARDIY